MSRQDQRKTVFMPNKDRQNLPSTQASPGNDDELEMGKRRVHSEVGGEPPPLHRMRILRSDPAPFAAMGEADAKIFGARFAGGRDSE